MAKKYFICAVCKKKGNSFLIFLAVVPLHGPASVKLENFAMRANKKMELNVYVERMTGSKTKLSTLKFLIRVLHFLFFFGIFSYLHGLIRTYMFIYFWEKVSPTQFFT